jgi:hypothetical protein
VGKNNKEIFNKFISEKKLVVDEKMKQLNEVLSIENLKVINILSQAHECTNDDILIESLNEKINFMSEYDNRELQTLGEQIIINLRNVANVAKQTCVLKVWEEYINDVLIVFAETIEGVPQVYERHKIINSAMEIREKVKKKIFQ